MTYLPPPSACFDPPAMRPRSQKLCRRSQETCAHPGRLSLLLQRALPSGLCVVSCVFNVCHPCVALFTSGHTLATHNTRMCRHCESSSHVKFSKANNLPKSFGIPARAVAFLRAHTLRAYISSVAYGPSQLVNFKFTVYIITCLRGLTRNVQQVFMSCVLCTGMACETTRS